ncbi:RNA methyltransferase [Gordonia humi]|uniref:tRNA G18 (Ribose-2'-O)-methylase SpoU n=1 Tax=Gordonia humi TaxID=686429 RepID=A0A840EXG5_9ACTN|nr:tRNA G18 (ribose-2'-O)-methylase SpoU [Gordonia humi]
MSERLTVEVIDITDPSDPRVDDFRDLNSVDRRPDLPALPGGAVGKALVIAEGVLVVQRMIASRFAPHALFGVDRRLEELSGDFVEGADGVPFYRASKEVMAQVIGFHLNRGVLAAARRPTMLGVADVIAGARTVAVLEGVNDHENIGSVFRNAAGLDVDAVIFGTGCADPLYRRCVRVSMGHALLVPFAKSENWPGDLELLRENGFRTVAMTPGEGSVPLREAIAPTRGGDATGTKLAFLVGAEGPGLVEHTMRQCDVRAHIPMSRGTDSLNVATAAAVAFYEALSR